MKISINKAIKLRNKLDQLRINKSNSVSALSTTDLQALFDGGQRELMEAMGDDQIRIGVVSELRDLIRHASDACGASKIVLKIACEQASLSLLAPYTTPVRGVAALADIKATIDFQTEQGKRDPALAKPPTRVMFSLLDDTLVNSITTECTKLRLEINNLTEQRNELNHKHTVELSDEHLTFLRKYSLI